MRRLNAKQLHSMLEKIAEPPILLDVREPWEFDFCRIPGSINVPLGNLEVTLPQLDPNRQTVVICHHGIRSFHAACFLEQNSFNQVINLEGGIDDWSRNVDPNVPIY